MWAVIHIIIIGLREMEDSHFIIFA